MTIDSSYNKKIHHITHYSNLIKIIQQNHLYCGNVLQARNIIPTNIGHTTLKQNRACHCIDIRPTTTINDYVPFFFTTRPPMIIAIAKGSVTEYQGTQREIIYLVSSISKIIDANCSWCFTDGHAIEALTRYYENLEQLSEIDWDAIRDWDYRPTANDPDKPRRKQAEFLVHECVPWSCIESITVKDQVMQKCVQEILSNSQHKPHINIDRNWYYNQRRRQE
jgi:hypothetical protein